jgi:hypothetical protein
MLASPQEEQFIILASSVALALRFASSCLEESTKFCMLH